MKHMGPTWVVILSVSAVARLASAAEPASAAPAAGLVAAYASSNAGSSCGWRPPLRNTAKKVDGSK